ncbi:hypothetical protein BLNAU_3667 [Blattamonas nauphoetae]|uniref:Protein RFT1 homolog n=1 Tax=Blattamonas nauphoetae TaxID=2049346 RepID=A0ABQ9YC33_9EUKA|nr:hypothetical protein BLNAU_3667 [Blattamonas nauphoetae]
MIWYGLLRPKNVEGYSFNWIDSVYIITSYVEVLFEPFYILIQHCHLIPLLLFSECLSVVVQQVVIVVCLSIARSMIGTGARESDIVIVAGANLVRVAINGVGMAFGVERQRLKEARLRRESTNRDPNEQGGPSPADKVQTTSSDTSTRPQVPPHTFSDLLPFSSFCSRPPFPKALFKTDLLSVLLDSVLRLFLDFTSPVISSRILSTDSLSTLSQSRVPSSLVLASVAAPLEQRVGENAAKMRVREEEAKKQGTQERNSTFEFLEWSEEGLEMQSPTSSLSFSPQPSSPSSTPSTKPAADNREEWEKVVEASIEMGRPLELEEELQQSPPPILSPRSSSLPADAMSEHVDDSETEAISLAAVVHNPDTRTLLTPPPLPDAPTQPAPTTQSELPMTVSVILPLALRFALYAAIFIFAFLAPLSTELVSLLFGQQWLKPPLSLPLYTFLFFLVAALLFVNGTSEALCRSLLSSSLLFASSVALSVSSVVYFGLTWWLGSKFQVFGMAVAELINSLVRVITSWVLLFLNERQKKAASPVTPVESPMRSVWLPLRNLSQPAIRSTTVSVLPRATPTVFATVSFVFFIFLRLSIARNDSKRDTETELPRFLVPFSLPYALFYSIVVVSFAAVYVTLIIRKDKQIRVLF